MADAFATSAGAGSDRNRAERATAALALFGLIISFLNCCRCRGVADVGMVDRGAAAAELAVGPGCDCDGISAEVGGNPISGALAESMATLDMIALWDTALAPRRWRERGMLWRLRETKTLLLFRLNAFLAVWHFCRRDGRRCFHFFWRGRCTSGSSKLRVTNFR